MSLPDLGGGYTGSRKEKDRYRYLKTNLAGFIELCPDKRIDKDQLRALIEEETAAPPPPPPPPPHHPLDAVSQAVRDAFYKCCGQGVEQAIADTLDALTTKAQIKEISHLGMVEVPSKLAHGRLVFRDDETIAPRQGATEAFATAPGFH